MPTFSYTARNVEGKTVTGMVTADNQQHVLRTLDEQSLFPVEVTEGGQAKSYVGGRKRKVSPTKVAVFYSQFADLLRAGVPALRSLDVLHKQTSNPVFKEIIGEVREDLARGETLADAMEKHANAFSTLHVSMIRAGERGGFLEEVLVRIATFTERQNELRNKLIGSMLYPAILMLVGAGVVIFLLVVVVPKVKSFLTAGNLPAITTFVFAVCDFLQNNGLVVGGAAFVLLLVTFGILRSESGRNYWDRFQLKIPKFGKVVTLVAICRFCRILGTLLHNGVPILQALKISRDSAGNRMLGVAIDEATESVRKGAALATPLLRSGMFPLDIVDMIAVGEESNSLEHVLVTIADSYETRTAREIDLMVRILEPMLLIMMAGVVAVIAVALLLPILSMSAGGIS